MTTEYSKFIERIEKKFTTDSSELHYIKNVVRAMFNQVSAFRYKFDKYNSNIYIQLEKDVDNMECNFDNRLLDYLSEYKELKSSIKKMHELIYRFRTLSKRIINYGILYSMTERDYNKIMLEYGNSLAKKLVLSGTLILPCKLGTIEVCLTEHNKPRIDWGASNRMKQLIIDEGKIPKDMLNPNGEKWIVYHTEEIYPFIRYTFNSKIHNLQFYKLAVSNYNNFLRDGVVENAPRSIDDCFNSRYGLIQKLSRYMKFDINGKLKYKYTNEKS